MTTKHQIKCWKFNEHAIDEPPELGDPLELLKEKFNGSGCFSEIGMPDIINHGLFKLMGWCYDLKPWLNKYLVPLDKESINYRHAYAPNRRKAREALSLSRIYPIYEFPKN